MNDRGSLQVRRRVDSAVDADYCAGRRGTDADRLEGSRRGRASSEDQWQESGQPKPVGYSSMSRAGHWIPPLLPECPRNSFDVEHRRANNVRLLLERYPSLFRGRASAPMPRFHDEPVQREDKPSRACSLGVGMGIFWERIRNRRTPGGTFGDQLRTEGLALGRVSAFRAATSNTGEMADARRRSVRRRMASLLPLSMAFSMVGILP